MPGKYKIPNDLQLPADVKTGDKVKFVAEFTVNVEQGTMQLASVDDISVEGEDKSYDSEESAGKTAARKMREMRGSMDGGMME